MGILYARIYCTRCGVFFYCMFAFATRSVVCLISTQRLCFDPEMFLIPSWRFRVGPSHCRLYQHTVQMGIAKCPGIQASCVSLSSVTWACSIGQGRYDLNN